MELGCVEYSVDLLEEPTLTGFESLEKSSSKLETVLLERTELFKESLGQFTEVLICGWQGHCYLIRWSIGVGLLLQTPLEYTLPLVSPLFDLIENGKVYRNRFKHFEFECLAQHNEGLILNAGNVHVCIKTRGRAQSRVLLRQPCQGVSLVSHSPAEKPGALLEHFRLVADLQQRSLNNQEILQSGVSSAQPATWDREVLTVPASLGQDPCRGYEERVVRQPQLSSQPSWVWPSFPVLYEGESARKDSDSHASSLLHLPHAAFVCFFYV